MTQRTLNPSNLVFEGGGVKGAAYAGAVDVLDQHGLYHGVRRVAGTSAGSITASLLACGAGPKGLRESVQQTHFHAFIADRGGIVGDVARVATHYGMHTGNGFVGILKNYLARFAGNAELTFGALEAMAEKQPQRFKSLSVVASNVTRQRSEVFSADSHPDLPIWQAVRASISIPLVFEPMVIDGEHFVDGGLAQNFPIDLFDGHCDDPGEGIDFNRRNPGTLGFYLEPHSLTETGGAYNPPRVDINSLKSYGLALTSFLTEAANSRYIHPEDKARTVFIDDLGVSSTDFDAPAETIEALVESGRKATLTWLADRGYGAVRAAV